MAVFALFGGGRALAAEGGPSAPIVELDWSAPEGCPAREEIERRIVELVGDGAVARPALHIHAVVSGGGPTPFRADVDIGDGAKKAAARRIDGESCEAIGDAVTVMVVFALDPRARVETRTPPRDQPPAAPANRASPSRSTWFAALAGRGDIGALPAGALGGELAAGWASPHITAEVLGALVGPARAELASHPGQGADVRLTDVGGRVCATIFDAPIDIGPCAAIEGRWFSAHGFGSDKPVDASSFVGVASFGALARARITRLVALRLVAGPDFPLARPAFVIDTAGTVHRTAPWAGRAAVGAELHF